jgi:hypothetical protein
MASRSSGDVDILLEERRKANKENAKAIFAGICIALSSLCVTLRSFADTVTPRIQRFFNTLNHGRMQITESKFQMHFKMMKLLKNYE